MPSTRPLMASALDNPVVHERVAAAGAPTWTTGHDEPGGCMLVWSGGGAHHRGGGGRDADGDGDGAQADLTTVRGDGNEFLAGDYHLMCRH